jgi:hypothetical protein
MLGEVPRRLLGQRHGHHESSDGCCIRHSSEARANASLFLHACRCKPPLRFAICQSLASTLGFPARAIGRGSGTRLPRFPARPNVPLAVAAERASTLGSQHVAMSHWSWQRNAPQPSVPSTSQCLIGRGSGTRFLSSSQVGPSALLETSHPPIMTHRIPDILPLTSSATIPCTQQRRNYPCFGTMSMNSCNAPAGATFIGKSVHGAVVVLGMSVRRPPKSHMIHQANYRIGMLLHAAQRHPHGYG